MRFSDEQRLIVLMLCDIGARFHQGGVDTSTFEKEDFSFIRKVVTNGHEWAVPWKFSGLISNGSDSPAVTEVISILETWRCLEPSISSLSSDQRAQLEQQVGAHALSFDGFDSAQESDQLTIAKILVEDLERYPEFRSRVVAAAFPRLDHYQRMRSRFEQMCDDLGATPSRLTFEQLQEVFSGF